MFDLDQFGLAETFEMSAALPELTRAARGGVGAAAAITRYCYENVVDKRTGGRALALAQCFVARPFNALEPELQDLAVTASAGRTPHPRELCLTLLGSAGDEQACADRRIARAMATVPVGRGKAEMLAPVAAIVVDALARGETDNPLVCNIEAGSYAVGLVADTKRSESLRNWSGVTVAYGIRSILTVATQIDRDLFAAVSLHSKVPIPTRTADAFGVVAISLKLAMLQPLVAEMWSATPTDVVVLHSELAAMRELLRARQAVALDQALRLEQALDLAESRAAELARSQAALAASEAHASTVIRAALDAVIVMDSSGRVVEWNPAAETTFGYTRDEAVGELVADLIVPDDMRQRHAQGLANYLATGDGAFIGQRVEVNAMNKTGGLLPVELTITPDTRPGEETTFTGFVRDITDRLAREAELLTSREEFARIARTLQRSLLPAALPRIHGIDTAAAYHPSRAGSEVGGDFYDVFRLGRAELMLTLGDVCGKGAEAAAITAIARHTVRAVASELRHPAPILRRLNDALLDHDIGERFCSMIGARAVPIVRGVRLTVCCGGHAPALVVRESGAVEYVGVPGDLLGLFAEVRLLEETVQLAYGDTFIMFTDGVTEARRRGEQFGDERARAILIEARTEPVAAMVDALLDAVLAFGGQQSHDDIAILALRPLPDQSTT